MMDIDVHLNRAYESCPVVVLGIYCSEKHWKIRTEVKRYSTNGVREASMRTRQDYAFNFQAKVQR